MRIRGIVVAAAAWLSLAAAAAATAADAPVPPTAEAYAAKAEALVDHYVKDGRFSGAVLVARDGKPILRKGFGLANREWDVAVTPDTEFRLGSVTKQFTATAVLQLVEQGKIGLDDPIGRYYASAPKAWAKVTIRHLLTHRSGIPSYTDISGFFSGPSHQDRTPDEIIALTRDQPLQFEPGTKYAYDNTGYIILGWVIEKVSGQTYADYVRDHIFKPLGMNHTGYDVSAEILPHRASGYSHDKTGTVRNADYLAMSLPYAAGSLYSDIDDLLTWDQALYASKPLKPETMADMFTDHGDHYGYGWDVSKVDDRRVWSHSGGINGFHTHIARYPDQKLTVVVLSNMVDAPVEKIALQLAHLNFGEPTEPHAKPGEVARKGTEAALRNVLEGLRTGHVDYDRMSPDLAGIVRQHPEVTPMIQGYGAITSVTFIGGNDKGEDIYLVRFEHAASQWRLKLDAAGKMTALTFEPA